MALTITSISAPIKRLLADDRGVSAIEYGLLASLVALASVQAMGGLGDVLDTSFGAAASDFSEDGTADDIVTGMTAGDPSASGADGTGGTGGDGTDTAREPSVSAADVPPDTSAYEPSVAAADVYYEPSVASIKAAPDYSGNNGNGGGNGGGGGGMSNGGGASEPSVPLADPDSGS